ncbi:hypothetical protein [Saccharicrinis aurantiacus]|uniref:hypothetical protein n=1 Tax=Saccharicrinis aurantiacus TaxID=1849719 RepID=UPI0008384B6E|nr:hypothetical protein [Saccharicrinis aurantiacus]
MKNIGKYILVFIMLFISINSKGQLVEKTNHSGSLNLEIGEQKVTLPDLNFTINRSFKSANFWLSLDFDKAVDVQSNMPTSGKVIVKLKLKASKGSAEVPNIFTSDEIILTLDNANIQASYMLDILKDFSPIGECVYSDILVNIMDVQFVDIPRVLIESLELTYHLEQSFAADPTNIEASEIFVDNIEWGESSYEFKWLNSNNYPYQYYQLQLLRLYNEIDQAEYLKTTQKIKATVDWNKAGTYIIKGQSDENNQISAEPFTIPQGTGFYIWRVRPVSGYHKGELANIDNYGVWSNKSIQQGKVLDLDLSKPDLIPLSCFYFSDPNQEINYNYSRIFTENGKSKELVTYANGLNQVKQTSTYLKSENVSVTTQTILDHTGRPALVTMPVPVDGKNIDYTEELVRSAVTGELYTADNFDTEQNFQNPEAIKEDKEFLYYNNSHNNVAAAEGYAYTRTIFNSDGTGRIKEQSGVGKAHSINTIDEEKHTTRYFYESATKDELLALFGDEAPNYEFVFKTITVDPNQVATVTFTNKEGQTIATGLNFRDDDGLNQIRSGANSYQYEAEIKHRLKHNIKTKDGFISSKRIYIPDLEDKESYPLTINYSIDQKTLDKNCVSVEFDCDYELTIEVLKVNDDNTLSVPESDDANNTSQNFVRSFDINQVELVNGEYRQIEPYTLNLPEGGTYIINKTLIPRGLKVNTSNNEGKIRAQVKGITELILYKLSEVEEYADLPSFTNDLLDISHHFINKTYDQLFIDYDANISDKQFFAEQWVNEYYTDDEQKLAYSLEVTIPEGSNIATKCILNTSCCSNVNIPIDWVPPFDCDRAAEDDEGAIINPIEVTPDGDRSLAGRRNLDNDHKFNINDAPDYEKQMVMMLFNCMEKVKNGDVVDWNTTVTNFYQRYMYGWDYNLSNIDIDVENGLPKINKLPGVFNEMVYHMAYDEYKDSEDDDPELHYTCQEMYDCWKGVVSKLKTELPNCEYIAYSMDGRNVSNAYDDEKPDEDTDDGTYKDHNPHFDDGLKGSFFIIRWIAKRKISKRMRDLNIGAENTEPDLSTKQPESNLVLEFLECTGYNFAKILTPYDACPLEDDKPIKDYKYAVEDYSSKRWPIPLNFNKQNSSLYFADTDDNFKKQDGSMAYIPLNNNLEEVWYPKAPGKVLEDDTIGEPIEDKRFRYVFNPYYAFKYFHYDATNLYVSDDKIDHSIAHDKDFDALETGICFSDPNDCFLSYERMDEDGVSRTFYSLDDNKQRIIGPCCAENFQSYHSIDIDVVDNNCPFCYKAENYGKNNETKLLVRDFAGLGRINCPYTYQSWNMSQRYSFLQRIKNFVPPSSLSNIAGGDWLDGFEKSEETPADKYEMGTEFVKHYTEPHKWYYTAKSDGSIDVIDVPYVTYEFLNANGIDPETEGYDKIEPDSELILDETFVFVEKDMFELTKECETNCRRRETEFRTAFYQMLNDRCYVIGDCRTNDPATHNIIPYDDVEILITALIDNCSQQCEITTYAIDELMTRRITKSRTEGGADGSEYKMHYGVAGMSANQIAIEGGTYQDNNASYYETQTYNLDKEYRRYNFDIDGDMYPDDLILSWLQYTLQTQALDWDFDLSLPDKCNDTSNTTNDYLESDYKENTFIDKGTYEVNPNIITDTNKANEPVSSAPILIEKCLGKNCGEDCKTIQ